MSMLVLLPVLIPLAAGALGLVSWRYPALQRAIAIVGSLLLLAAGMALTVIVERDGIQTLQVSDWGAPFGITLVADLFSAILIVLAGVLAVAIVLYSTASIDDGRERHGYYPLVMLLLAGVCGTFVTGDLFNLYVWFEVLLIGSFVLLALGGERAQLEGALKYVAINLIASATLLITIGVTYGLTGTLNLADLSLKLGTVEPPGMVSVLAVLMLVAFGIKAALVPLHFWLPASYPTPPVAVAALFAGLLTKVGIYALVRVSTLLFPGQIADLQPALLVIAALTMVVGVIGAVAQHEMRRLLSFHIISQIGYLLMGLALLTVASLAGLIYFLVHVAIAKATLFLVSGAVARTSGSFELARNGGLWTLRPVLAVLFGIAAMALAGIPPFSGFLAKLALVEAGLASDQLIIVFIALAVSLLTLYSMLKIWNAAFWRSRPESPGEAPGERTSASPGTEERAAAMPDAPERLPRALTLPIAFLVLCTIGLTVMAGPVFDLVDAAAVQLFDTTAYVDAVLGDVTGAEAHTPRRLAGDPR